MLDQELLARAENNDIEAIFEVAKAYYTGNGVEEDNDKAFELFTKVAMSTAALVDVVKRGGVLLLT